MPVVAKVGGSDREVRHSADQSVHRPRPRGDRPERGPVPVDHAHGAGRRGRLLDHRRRPVRRRRATPGGGARAGRLPAGGRLHRPARQAPAFGFLVAWGYAFAEPFVAPLLYLIFGNVVGGVLSSEFGWSFETWWVISAVVAAVVVFVLGYLRVCMRGGMGRVLGIFEIGVFLALALWLIVKAGNANTLAVFGTGQATVEGFTGFSGIAAASIYTILAFIGFEAAAPLAEEAKDPRRTIRQAVIYSAPGIGVFYVITTYAATVFFGPDKMAGFAKFGNGNPWDGLARQVWGVGWVVVFLAIANSAIANANVAANATTRTWYAMGRIRL